MAWWNVDARDGVAQRVTVDAPAPPSEGGRFWKVEAESAGDAVRIASRRARDEEAEELPPAKVIVSDILVIQAMQRFGGGFVKALGEAAMKADLVNLRRIKQAFPELWERYAEIARGGR